MSFKNSQPQPQLIRTRLIKKGMPTHSSSHPNVTKKNTADHSEIEIEAMLQQQKS